MRNNPVVNKYIFIFCWYILLTFFELIYSNLLKLILVQKVRSEFKNQIIFINMIHK